MDKDTQQADDKEAEDKPKADVKEAEDKPKTGVKSAKDKSTKDTQAAEDKSTKEEESVKELSETVLLVTAKVDGFRRAGREWHGSTKVRVSEFTEEQLEQLIKEPKLHVIQVA